MTDVQLLQSWRASRDRGAMDELVRRHARFVYGTSLRMMRHTAWADDVTQAVFLLLIQKPPRFVHHDAALAAWVHRTTVYACKNARRVRARRGRHETCAARFDVDRSADPADRAMSADDARLLPMLDDAIQRLAPHERDGVILWYFQHRTYRQIGDVMGVSEDAARKRVGRAVERLRDFFASRGFETTSASSISACLIAHATHDISRGSIIESISGMNTVAHLADVKLAASSLQIMKGVLHSMWITKLQVAAAAAVFIAMAAGAATFASNVATKRPAPILLSTSAGVGDPVVQLADGTTLEFLGVSPRPANEKSWFTIEGTPIDHNPSGPFATRRMEVSSTQQIAMRLHGAIDVQLRPRVANSTHQKDFMITSGPNEAFILVPFMPKEGATTVGLTVQVADGEWTRVCEAKFTQPGQFGGRYDTPHGSVSVTHVMPVERGCEVYVVHEVMNDAWRVCAIDDNGELHPMSSIRNHSSEKITMSRITFDIPPERVTSIAVEVRPFSKVVTVKNISLKSGHATKPEVEVSEKK